MTFYRMACIVCGYPITWHRDTDSNRTITCAELMMAHGARTTDGIRAYLYRSAEAKRRRGLKRLRVALTPTVTPCKRRK